MGYIYTQTDYTVSERLWLGPSEEQSINQSVVFKRNFQLNAINLLFGEITFDPIEDLKFRIEVRRPYGSGKYLDLDSEIIDYSNWVNDDNLLNYSYVQFVFNQNLFNAGTYYFSLVSNMRVKYPINLALKINGYFQGYFVKIENGTGIYRHDWSIVFKIDGIWGFPIRPIFVHETNKYTETIIRDKS